MKLKQLPEDFQVEELTEVTPGPLGPFGLYRLTKRGVTTPDALGIIRRRWKLEQRRLSCGGLKDRHALTTQYLTVFRGPQRTLRQQGIMLEYLGQVPEPYSSRDIRANRFRVTLRSLNEASIARMRQGLAEVDSCGLPNYFDDQRFGSVEGHGQFVAKALTQGKFEEALKLALSAPYPHDRAAAKHEKATLRRHWGDWAICKTQLPTGQARNVVDYLEQYPGDYCGALQRLRPELRGLYLSAYQSHLWNKLLGSWLSKKLRAEQLLSIKLQQASVPMPRRLDPGQLVELESLSLPLPGPKVELDEKDPRLSLLDAVLRDESITREQLRLKSLKDTFFSKGERAALIRPGQLTSESGPDDLNPTKQRLTLGFDLPRGSYATLLVKRLQFG